LFQNAIVQNQAVGRLTRSFPSPDTCNERPAAK
jgi:hypothetical protein